MAALYTAAIGLEGEERQKKPMILSKLAESAANNIESSWQKKKSKSLVAAIMKM